jgi:pyruvate carboxylase
MPRQDDVPRNGYAIQCRITTEDPENKFMPDYGRIIAYRSPGGFGVRLDGGMGYAGAVITPFYDSLLVKVITSGQTLRDRDEPHASARCSRVPHPRREDQHPVPRERHRAPLFRAGQATTTLIDTSPELFAFKPRRDRATKLLNFLGNVIVNGNPHAKGYRRPSRFPAPLRRQVTTTAARRPPARATCCWQLGREGLRRVDAEAEAPARHRHDVPRRPPVAHGHARAHLRHAGLRGRRAHARRALFSLEMWGGATFDTAMRFLNEDPWERLRQLRAKVPNICFQMLFRGANAVGYTNYPDNVVAGS